MNQSKIYVGNFSYSVTEEELNEFFSQYGAIQELNLIKDRETGRSRGFAFISYESQQVAENVINVTNGKEFKGRTLTVNMARDERRTGGGGGRDGGRRGNGGGRGDGGRARW